MPSGPCLVASPPDAPGAWEGPARGCREQPARFGHRHADQADVPGRLLAGTGRQLAGVAPVFGLAGGAGAGIRIGGGGPGHRGAGWPGGRYGEQREGAHGQRGVPVEGVPEAELVLVKAGLPLSLLEALLYGPALPGDLDQDGQGHQGGGVAVEERQVGRVGDLAADQQPVPRGAGRDQCPLVVAVAPAAPHERVSQHRAGTSLARAATAALRPAGVVTVKFTGTAKT